jgi:glycosyltransferase involved in cell wall biosynthesis
MEDTIDRALPSGQFADFAGGRPKVLFIIDTLKGHGGAEGALLRLATGLPRFGFDCSVAAMQLLQDPEFQQLFGCPMHELALRRTYGLSGMRAALKLRRLVTQNRYDIVHTIFPSSDLWAAPIAKLAGTGALLVSGRRDMGILRRPAHKILYRWTSRLFDQVQAVSEEVRRVTISADGTPPERVVCVYNGVELNRMRSGEPGHDLRSKLGLDPRGATVVTAVGKLWPVKGLDVLIRAAALVCRERPHTNFVLAGWVEQGTAYTEELKALAKSLGVERNLYYPGRLGNIEALLKISDVFCLLSRSEGMPNALLEAMACGLPCVATAVGGTPEVLSDDAGFLVQSEDSEAAAGRILDLLGNDRLRNRMGAAGQKRVQNHFTSDLMVRRVAGLYRDLIAGRDAR